MCSLAGLTMGCGVAIAAAGDNAPLKRLCDNAVTYSTNPRLVDHCGPPPSDSPPLLAPPTVQRHTLLITTHAYYALHRREICIVRKMFSRDHWLYLKIIKQCLLQSADIVSQHSHCQLIL